MIIWYFVDSEIGKYQFILVILSAINFLGASIENTNVSYVAPYAKCDLKLSSGEQGLLSAIQFLGIIFTSHLWGFLADTWGRQKVLRASALGAFLFSFSSGFAINTASMLILRFLAGGLYVWFLICHFDENDTNTKRVAEGHAFL